MKFSSIAGSLLVLLLVVSCGVEQTAEIPNAAPFQTTFAAARTESQATGRNVLVDFYTDW